MRTAYSYDERCLRHDNGSMLLDGSARDWLSVPHVERPERLARTVDVLAEAGVLDRLIRLDPRAATHDELALVHTREMIAAIETAAARGEPAWIGAQARVGAESWEPALLAAGNVLAATDAVLDGVAENAFAARPPAGPSLHC